MIYHFDEFRLDTEKVELRLHGNVVEMEPQVFALLQVLIENRHKVLSKDQLIELIWQGRPLSDSVVSSRIKSARKAIGDDGTTQRLIKTLHGRGFRFVADVQVTDSAESAVDATPQEQTIQSNTPAAVQAGEGLAPTLNPNASNPIAKATWFTPRNIALAVLAVIGLASWISYVSSPAEPERLLRDKSIAVLPFENNSSQADDLYFTDGIHGDLLAQISKIKNIKSISRTSVMTYRDSDKNLQQIAKELGVATILEGGVQRSGNQVRINMQLIDAKTDVPIWALTYTRELSAENLFQIQSEIATAIAQKLQADFTASDKDKMTSVPTHNLAALELYFKAKAETDKLSTAGYQQAVEYLQQAIALDENFANAYIELARIYLEQTFYGGLSRDKQLALAHGLIDKAKSLEGENSSAVITIEAQYIEYSNQHALAEQIYQQAIALNPNNVSALVNYGHMLNWIIADYPKSIQMYQAALRLDPANLSIQQQLAESLNNGGRAADAIVVLKNIIARDPNLPTVWLGLCRTYAEAMFQYDNSIPACRQAMALDPHNPFLALLTAISYGNLGDMQQMAALAGRAYSLSSETYAYLGEQRFALNQAEAALEAFYQVKKGTIFFRHSLGFIATLGLQHDVDGALAFFQRNYPELMSEQARVDLTTLYPAYYFAKLLAKKGYNEVAARLTQLGLAFITDNLESFALQEYPVITNYYLAAGQQEQAFSYFKQFVERGGVAGDIALVSSMSNLMLNFPDEPQWQTRSDYQHLMATMQTRLQQQRSNVQNLELNKQLAPIPLL